MRTIIFLPTLLALGAPLAAETVTSHELRQDVSGYPCIVSMQTAEGPKVSLQLSDYKDICSLNIFVANAADEFRPFFDERGLRDEEAWEERFRQVTIGERTFDLHETSLMEVDPSRLDERSSGTFSIQERHHVAAALNALEGDGLALPSLVTLANTGGAAAEFRTCAYTAMGLEAGERVETDYRAEYRMIFERSLEAWVTHAATAETCMQRRVRSDEIDAVIARAASAFLSRPLQLLEARRVSGRPSRTAAPLPPQRVGGRHAILLYGDNLVEMSFMPVERSIEQADDLA